MEILYFDTLAITVILANITQVITHAFYCIFLDYCMLALNCCSKDEQCICQYLVNPQNDNFKFKFKEQSSTKVQHIL